MAGLAESNQLCRFRDRVIISLDRENLCVFSGVTLQIKFKRLCSRIARSIGIISLMKLTVEHNTFVCEEVIGPAVHTSFRLKYVAVQKI
jgi:hypothetical protein